MTAETLRTSLHTIRQCWPMMSDSLVNAAAGSHTKLVRGTVTPERIALLSVKAQVSQGLATFACDVARGIGQCLLIHLLDPMDTSLYLLGHCDWIAGSVLADDAEAKFEAMAQVCRECAGVDIVRRFQVGRCPRCGGRLTAYIGAEPVISCDRDPEHNWSKSQWVMLGLTTSPAALQRLRHALS